MLTAQQLLRAGKLSEIPKLPHPVSDIHSLQLKRELSANNQLKPWDPS